MNFLQQVYVLLAFLALNYLVKGEDAEALKQKPNNLCKSQPNGALLDHPNDCHKFYICINHRPYEYNCDPDFHYDATTRTCVAGSSCSSDSNKPATCSEGTIKASKDDCYIFEACIKGQYQKLNCPPNYYFNAKQAHCMPFTYDAELKCNCIMPEHTVMENKNNCETYYVCREKSAILENCPLGQYYNVQLNTCITDLDGVCLMKPTITPELEEELGVNHLNKMENGVQAACAKLGLQGIHFQTFPQECNTFYICVNGQLYTQHCPEDFYYDSDKKYCVLDDSNKCSKAKEDLSENLTLVKENVETPKIYQENKLFSKFIKF